MNTRLARKIWKECHQIQRKYLKRPTLFKADGYWQRTMFMPIAYRDHRIRKAIKIVFRKYERR